MIRKALLLLLFPLLLGILCSQSCPCVRTSKSSLETLYHSLDPLSVSQHLAFYELYPETEEGHLALQHAWKLLSHSGEEREKTPIRLPTIDIHFLISLVNRQPLQPIPPLEEEQFLIIDSLAKNLKNRNLKGHFLWKEEDLLRLPPEEIDLSRGLFIAQMGDKQREIRSYEALLDLMALQVLARLSPSPSAEELIQAMNYFIFYELHFRFPPHSLYAKEIDTFTFLPSVLDGRRGVCLGVSILYLSIAQRLGLSLEAVTPPGHIFLRYRKPDGDYLNIETTARGIHLPTEIYLGIETRSLQKRTLKEIIGLAFENQASTDWMKGDYQHAVSLYEKALPYVPEDLHLQELLALNYLFIGKLQEGKAILQKVRDYLPEEAIVKDSLAEDYLENRVDIEGIKAVFLPVDEDRKSIVTKQKQLEALAQRFPLFRSGLLQLATTWLQLGREKEALQILKKFAAIDQGNPIVNYYVAAICCERYDYNQAWAHVLKAEEVLFQRNHHPKALKDLREELLTHSPPPH